MLRRATKQERCNELSIFMDVEPGDIRNFSNMTPAEVMKLFEKHFKRQGVAAECEYWTYPACRATDQRVRQVWLMRTDGLSQEQIEQIKADHIEAQGDKTIGEQSFTVDGKVLCQDIPRELEHRSPRRTKAGWERMQVGDGLMIRIHTRDLRNVLSLAVIKRRLDWAFKCERDSDLAKETQSKVPYWHVRRIR